MVLALSGLKGRISQWHAPLPAFLCRITEGGAPELIAGSFPIAPTFLRGVAGENEEAGRTEGFGSAWADFLQLAFEFIKSMTDETADLHFLNTTFQLPRRKNMDSLSAYETFFGENPKMKVFAEQAKYIRGVGNNEVMTEVLDIISQEYEACVLYQKKTPEQAIADAEKAVNVILRAD